MLSTNEKAARTIHKVFGMTRPRIKTYNLPDVRQTLEQLNHYSSRFESNWSAEFGRFLLYEPAHDKINKITGHSRKSQFNMGSNKINTETVVCNAHSFI